MILCTVTLLHTFTLYPLNSNAIFDTLLTFAMHETIWYSSAEIVRLTRDIAPGRCGCCTSCNTFCVVEAKSARGRLYFGCSMSSNLRMSGHEPLSAVATLCVELSSTRTFNVKRTIVNFILSSECSSHRRMRWRCPTSTTAPSILLSLSISQVYQAPSAPSPCLR